MAISELYVARFSAFEDTYFEFAPGINVLIGENGTGKSHLLKLIYAMREAMRTSWLAKESSVKPKLLQYLQETFMADAVGRLVRRKGRGQQGPRAAEVGLSWGENALNFRLGPSGTLTIHEEPGYPDEGEKTRESQTLFLPTREFLSHYPHFVSSWEERELTFDRTYYDLCRFLNRAPLKGARDRWQRALLEPLEERLGGKVMLEGDYFYVQLKDGKMEAPLLAEGIRKLAMITWLVQNGSLRKNSLLLWDEPEASMNPQLAPLLATTVLTLARQGIQIVLATHDYIFAAELSRQIEAEADMLPQSAFFTLRPYNGDGPQVEKASSFAFLESNPIFDAMAALQDRTLGVETGS